MKKRRFSAVPYVAALLKVSAVFLLLAFGVQLFDGLRQIQYQWQLLSTNPEYLKEFLKNLIEAIVYFTAFPALAWALGEGFLALREIEFNTRVVAEGDAPAAEEVDQPAEAVVAE